MLAGMAPRGTLNCTDDKTQTAVVRVKTNIQYLHVNIITSPVAIYFLRLLDNYDVTYVIIMLKFRALLRPENPQNHRLTYIDIQQIHPHEKAIQIVLRNAIYMHLTVCTQYMYTVHFHDSLHIHR